MSASMLPMIRWMAPHLHLCEYYLIRFSEERKKGKKEREGERDKERERMHVGGKEMDWEV